WEPVFQGQVSLQATAIHRYESVGGFDWAAPAAEAGAHRPARRFVPAGSVYLFSSDGQALRPDLIQNANTDRGAEIGLGQAVIAPA
ncbi:MAG: CRISPR-associated protein Cmr3, partial [Anaerolineae bacterium]|nr:CRISPR-associated protein Cmr3 [Anaerolineae bacterium]